MNTKLLNNTTEDLMHYSTHLYKTGENIGDCITEIVCILHDIGPDEEDGVGVIRETLEKMPKKTQIKISECYKRIHAAIRLLQDEAIRISIVHDHLNVPRHGHKD